MKFKNSAGHYITKALFYENELSDKIYSVYSLKDKDHVVGEKVYPSLKRLFVEEEDLTEYSFATKYLDGWMHWKKICEQDWFKDHLLEWREELEVRVKSKTLARVMTKAKSSGKDSLTADRILLDFNKDKKKSSVGRPTKEKIRQEADLLFAARAEHDEDFERILGSLN
jgi:hypothetical protein